MINALDQIAVAIVLIGMVVGGGIAVVLWLIAIFGDMSGPGGDEQEQIPPPPWDDFWRH